ncbi:MAG: VOC family protein [Acidobacteria bacterium]|nr:MAG: VOC family protein [Acidobacteriota bacterium]
MKLFIAFIGTITAILLAATAVLMNGTPKRDKDERRPQILGIAHVALRVKNAAAARNFFGNVLGLDALPRQETTRSKMACIYFKVNDDQYIVASPTLSSPGEDRLIHIAFRTTDAKSLRRYLTSHGLDVPGDLRKDSEGDLSFTLKDPAGHTVEYIQYLPGSVESRNFGRFLSRKRTSRQIIHAGETVGDRTAADGFYSGVLGYRVMWTGGMTDTSTDWVDMVVPDGSNWLEFMLNVHNPSPRLLGVMNHLSLGVKNIQQVFETVKARGYKAQKPEIGRDGKWQLNLYDPDMTRVEFMEFKPVKKPCCSPMQTFN